MRTKKREIWGTPSGSRPVFGCQSALMSSQKLKSFLFFLSQLEKRKKNRNKVQEIPRSLWWKKTAKLVLTRKEMILTSKRCAEHPFVGQKTQHFRCQIDNYTCGLQIALIDYIKCPRQIDPKLYYRCYKWLINNPAIFVLSWIFFRYGHSGHV